MALVTLIDIQVFFDILIPDGETSDEYDLYSFYRKVTRENGIQLSRWFTLNKYICKKALLRDCTLIFTWDIEIYVSQMEEFAEVLEQKNKVFMICMILYWKDDPKPLKQICLVNLETTPDQ
ncbi:10500_t:CDS:2 [Funneliformis geosporum]|uniref:10500_t:CDS:1 n=1 Tax=Funneliformis geosporum TaxID=1117311 RepID=A0A9W4SEM9_9GLOM|nr:10500_t:CDS:2 [Funneliformis geosporum]